MPLPTLSRPFATAHTHSRPTTPDTAPDAKRSKTTDDIDAIPYSRSIENLVPCGFGSDDDDATTDGWTTADDDDTDHEEDDVDVNRCIQCGIDMGVHNPRQLCGKRYCRYAPGGGI